MFYRNFLQLNDNDIGNDNDNDINNDIDIDNDIDNDDIDTDNDIDIDNDNDINNDNENQQQQVLACIPLLYLLANFAVTILPQAEEDSVHLLLQHDQVL